MAIEPHQQRVVDELDELTNRLEKLTAYILTPAFQAKRGDVHSQLLIRQSGAMAVYEKCLMDRLRDWGARQLR